MIYNEKTGRYYNQDDDELYFTSLLSEFKKATYVKKLEIYDREFGIVNHKYANALGINQETKNPINQHDFDITPSNDEEIILFHKLMYRNFEQFLIKPEKLLAIHIRALIEYFRKIARNDVIHVAKYDSLIMSLEEKLSKQSAIPYMVYEGEKKIIQKYIKEIERLKGYKYIVDIYKKLVEGGEIDFLVVEPGIMFNDENYICIKIGENLANYHSYIEKQLVKESALKESALSHSRERYIVEIVSFVSGRCIPNESIDDFRDALNYGYILNNEQVVWKGSSVADLLKLVEGCIELNLIRPYRNEKPYDVVIRLFRPHKSKVRKAGKTQYDRHDLGSAKSSVSYLKNSEIDAFFLKLKG